MSSLYKKSSPSEPQLPADGPSETSVTRGFGCGGAAMTWLDHVEGHGDHGMCHPKTYSQHHIFGEHDMDKNIHESIYVYIYIIYTAFWDERKGAVPEFWSIAIVIFFQGMNQIDSIPFDQLMSGIFFVDEL